MLMLSNANAKQSQCEAKVSLKDFKKFLLGYATLVWKKEGNFNSFILLLVVVVLYLEGITSARLSKLKASRAKKPLKLGAFYAHAMGKT